MISTFVPAYSILFVSLFQINVQGSCLFGDKLLQNGERISNGAFWYECVNPTAPDVPGRAVLKGCTNPDTGAFLSNGDRYHSNSFVFECRTIGTIGGVERAIVGCLDSSGVEHAIGESYDENDGKQFSFTKECRRRDSGGAEIALSACKYYGTRIMPGCFKVIDKVTVTCTRRATGGLAADMHTYAGEGVTDKEGCIQLVS